MPFKNYLSELTDSEIIRIIENPEISGSVSQSEAENELASRRIALDTIKILAVTVNERIADQRILEAERTNNKIIQHTSRFLSKVEVWQIYINQFEKYVKGCSAFIMPFMI